MKMQHLEKASKGFRGKTKERFHRLCEGINDHSGVLKILPQEYAGSVCASVEMIVKVRGLLQGTSCVADLGQLIGFGKS